MSKTKPRFPLYKTNEEIEIKIKEYFDKECGIKWVKDDEGNIQTDRQGKPVFTIKPPTVTGMALYLGFMTRQSIYDYSKRAKFSYTIKKALLRCESFAEEQLYVNAHPVGAIFALKNRGWKDRKDVKMTKTTYSPEVAEKIKQIENGIQ